MKTHTGSISILYSLLTSVLEGGKRSASHPVYFISQERNKVPTKQDTGWAPELVWTVLEKRTSLGCCHRNLNPRLSSLYRVTILTMLSLLSCINITLFILHQRESTQNIRSPLLWPIFTMTKRKSDLVDLTGWKIKQWMHKEQQSIKRSVKCMHCMIVLMVLGSVWILLGCGCWL